MKIRNGFVSNSSSSSFVLLFDYNKVPKKYKNCIFDLLDGLGCDTISADIDENEENLFMLFDEDCYSIAHVKVKDWNEEFPDRSYDSEFDVSEFDPNMTVFEAIKKYVINARPKQDFQLVTFGDFDNSEAARVLIDKVRNLVGNSVVIYCYKG